MKYKVNKVPMGEEFKVCPVCQYADGFHSMFQREDEEVRWLFICPSCHEVFDINMRMPAPAE